MKKIINLLAGLFTGLLFVLVINQFLQGAAASVLLNQKVNYFFSGIKLVSSFQIPQDSFAGGLIVILIPIIVSFLLTEITMVILSKRNDDKTNIPLVIFILINTGYIILYIIITVISILFNNSLQNNFIILLTDSGFTYNQQLIFILAAAVLFFGYLNFVLKRMKRSLPAIIENKKK